MEKLITLDGIEKGDYLIQKISYEAQHGIVTKLQPMLVEKVRKNFIDLKDDYINVGCSLRKSAFKPTSMKYGRTTTWYKNN